MKFIKNSLLFLALLFSCSAVAQKPWKLNLIDPDKKITLTIDLYEESIEVPDMEMFGPMHGYLGGKIYGVWPVTSYKILKDKAILRLSSDQGGETQEAELTQTSDTTYTLKLTGSTVVKKVEGRKLVKITSTLNMIKK